MIRLSSNEKQQILEYALYKIEKQSYDIENALYISIKHFKPKAVLEEDKTILLQKSVWNSLVKSINDQIKDKKLMMQKYGEKLVKETL